MYNPNISMSKNSCNYEQGALEKIAQIECLILPDVMTISVI